MLQTVKLIKYKIDYIPTFPDYLLCCNLVHNLLLQYKAPFSFRIPSWVTLFIHRIDVAKRTIGTATLILLPLQVRSIFLTKADQIYSDFLANFCGNWATFQSKSLLPSANLTSKANQFYKKYADCVRIFLSSLASNNQRQNSFIRCKKTCVCFKFAILYSAQIERQEVSQFLVQNAASAAGGENYNSQRNKFASVMRHEN